jgi:putative transposase
LDDREGLFGLFDNWKNPKRKLKVIWVDGGYEGDRAREQAKAIGIELITVKRSDSGFKVLPRRWVVERTFAWLGRNRRLSKDYEYRTQTSESMIYLGMSRLMLRRIGGL